MSFYDAKQPMPDRQLVNLAQHRLDRLARGESTHEDYAQLRDIFPAVLGRFRAMVEGGPVGATVHHLHPARPFNANPTAQPLVRQS